MPQIHINLANFMTIYLKILFLKDNKKNSTYWLHLFPIVFFFKSILYCWVIHVAIMWCSCMY